MADQLQARLRVRCVCGWETVGAVDDAVDAALGHGQFVHNMSATREGVLATAEWLDEVDEAAGPT